MRYDYSRSGTIRLRAGIDGRSSADAERYERRRAAATVPSRPLAERKRPRTAPTVVDHAARERWADEWFGRARRQRPAGVAAYLRLVR